MGEVRLRWTGERIQFVGDTGYGDDVRVGGDPEGPGAKPSDLSAAVARGVHRL